MAKFISAFEKTMTFEGVYSLDPADPGGETVFGISRRNWPDWQAWALLDADKREHAAWTHQRTNTFPNLEMRQKYRALAQDFYEDEFWEKQQLHYFTNQRLAEKIFDMSVNLGVQTTARMLQHVLNKLNAQGARWQELIVDGDIGPATTDVVNEATQGNGHVTDSVLLYLSVMQGDRYLKLADAVPSMERFVVGWAKRVAYHSHPGID